MSLILAVAKNRLMNLRRDRAAFVLAFVLPVAFFTIFAAISPARVTRRRAGFRSWSWTRMAARSRNGSSGASRRRPACRWDSSPAPRTRPGPSTPPRRPQAVRKGDVPVALIMPKGLADADRLEPGTAPVPLRILADTADPIAPQVFDTGFSRRWR